MIKQESRETDLFEKSPVFKAIIKLALPSVMGQIILVIYNMADTFFVGLTGSDDMITAVTVCMPAFMFLSAISNLFGVGGASVISRALGQQKAERARRTSAFAFWGCFGITLLYSIGVLLLINPFVNILGGTASAVHQNACTYILVTVVIGGLSTALNTLFAHLIRAEGRSMQASIGIIIGGVLNIVLDPLFMFVILRPGQEVLGVALATMISNACALVYFVVVLIRNRKSLILSVRPDRDMFLQKIPKDVIGTGLPACLMTLCENISYAVMDKLMSVAGTATQAGVGVAKKVNMLAHSIVRGMTQGVLPLIGYNYAAGNKKRMKHTVYISAGMSVAISCVCMAISLIFSKELIGLFIQSTSSSLDYGEKFLRIMCIGAPFSALAYTVISFFQATGRGIKSMMLALMRKGILDIPLMFLLNIKYAVYGIVWATPIADILCSVAAVITFFAFLKRVPHREQLIERDEDDNCAPERKTGCESLDRAGF